MLDVTQLDLPPGGPRAKKQAQENKGSLRVVVAV